MRRMIVVSLPVRDVQVARDFYRGLGFAVNEQFSDEEVACVVVSDTIVVMLLEHSRFQGFITTAIADPRTHTEVLNGLSASSRAEIDDLMVRAVAGGGTARTTSDQDGVYGHSFHDPDGHIWELMLADTDVQQP